MPSVSGLYYAQQNSYQTIGGQVADNGMDTLQRFSIIRSALTSDDPASPSTGGPEYAVAHEPPGCSNWQGLFAILRQQERVRYPLFCRPFSTASFSNSFSMVLLPDRRCSSLIDFIAEASSDEGTTGSPAATAMMLPS